MSKWRVILMLFLSSGVHCEDCVIFDFEKDFNSSFSNRINLCNNVNGSMWNIGRYKDIPLDSPDPASSKFVYPSDELTCSSSYTFEMRVGGTLEVNMYLKALPRPTTDQVTIIVNQEVQDGHDTNVGIHTVFVSGDDFIYGWRTIRMMLTGRGTYRGYVILLGIAQIDAIILIDSLRYISPNIKAEECIIYEKIITPTICTTETDKDSTVNKSTELSSPHTTITTFTSEIKITTDYTITEHTQKTILTTQVGNTDLTNQEVQTKTSTKMQTGYPRTSTIQPVTFRTETTQSSIQPSTVYESTKTTLLSSDITTQTNNISTDKETTGPSTSNTTVSNVTPEIKSTNDYTTSDQSQETNPITTTKSGDSDFTKRDTQTEPYATTITENSKTTESTDPTFPIQSSTTESITLTTEVITPQSSTQFDITNTVYESTITTSVSSDKTTIEASEVIKMTTENSNQSIITYPPERTDSTIAVKDTTTSPISKYKSTTSGADDSITNNPTRYTEEITEPTTRMTSQTTTTNINSSSTNANTTNSATTTDFTRITETTTSEENESISTVEDIGLGTTEQSYTFITEDYSNKSTEKTTKLPPHSPRFSFWNAFTITMVIILILILVIFTAIVWYYIGKRSSPRKSQLILPYFEEPPNNTKSVKCLH